MTGIDRLPFTNVLEAHRLLSICVAFEQDIGKAEPAGELQSRMHIHAARPNLLGPQNTELSAELPSKTKATYRERGPSRGTKLKNHSFGAWFRSRDLRVMGPPRFRCATPNLNKVKMENGLFLF